jgi:hypothetical protein
MADVSLPTYSVVIPTYQRDQQLYKCLGVDASQSLHARPVGAEFISSKPYLKSNRIVSIC